MDIKDLKKAGVNDADEIRIKETDIKTKNKEIKKEEIEIKRRKRREFWEDVKKGFKKAKFILWDDDSFKGWLISLLFIFILVKFIFFPLLSLVTGTSLPLAIVESCSMYHNGNYLSNFDNWWSLQEDKYSKFDLNKEEFAEFKFQKGFTKGDILLIIKANPEKLNAGDVIIFNAGTNHPIIHRIINITETSNGKIFSTMGDNNPGQLSVETKIIEEQLVGKAVFRIVPYAGWVKLIFFEYLQPKNNKGFC